MINPNKLIQNRRDVERVHTQNVKNLARMLHEMLQSTEGDLDAFIAFMQQDTAAVIDKFMNMTELDQRVMMRYLVAATRVGVVAATFDLEDTLRRGGKI